MELAIPAASGLTFSATAQGTPGSPLVLFLHGFPETRYHWRHQLPAVAREGFYAVAPDLRGYSPGARPSGVDQYATELLVGDILEIADALGYERFHLAGHDWGGQLAWLAACGSGRVASLAVLSRPHPAAFARAMQQDAGQAVRSRHHRAFLDPETVPRLLADDCASLRAMFATQQVPPEAADAYLAVLSVPEAMEAAVNWYRAANGLANATVPNCPVPTLYLWGDQDVSVGRTAFELTREHVDAPYVAVVIEGRHHFLSDETAEVNGHIIGHLQRAGHAP